MGGEDDECFRSNPEFSGYLPPPIWACFLLPLTGVVIFILVTILGSWFNKVKRRGGHESDRSSSRSHSLGATRQFMGEDGNDFVELNTYENLGGAGVSFTQPSSASLASMTYVERLVLQRQEEAENERSKRKCNCVKLFRNVCNMFLLSILGIYTCAVILTLLYYPVVPSYSLCKVSEVSWLAMLEDWLMMRGVKSSINFHVSVYNPGHMGVSMQHMESVIMYKNEVVGRGNATDIKLPGGVTVDVQVPTEFVMDTLTAAKLAVLHETGELFLDFRLHVDGAHLLLFGAEEFGSFNLSTSYNHVDVEAPEDVTYCLPCNT